MNDKHWGFLLGSFWEVVRFALILLSYLTLIVPLRQPLLFLFIIWNSSVALSIVAAYIAMGLYPEKYGVYIHILRLAKIFSLIPGIAIFILIFKMNPLIRIIPDPTYALLGAAEPGAASGSPYQMLRLLFITIVTAFDIIFLLYLLLWGRERKKSKNSTPPDEHLPQLDEVHLDEVHEEEE